jgi:hypothetical protein
VPPRSRGAGGAEERVQVVRREVGQVGEHQRLRACPAAIVVYAVPVLVPVPGLS